MIFNRSKSIDNKKIKKFFKRSKSNINIKENYICNNCNNFFCKLNTCKHCNKKTVCKICKILYYALCKNCNNKYYKSKGLFQKL